MRNDQPYLQVQHRRATPRHPDRRASARRNHHAQMLAARGPHGTLPVRLRTAVAEVWGCEMTALFHGGVADLWKNSTLLPNMASRRYHEGCVECAAQRSGEAVALGFDPPTPHGFIYATTDVEYARYYASRAGSGWLYEVTLDPPIVESTEDPFPTWRAPQGRIVRVLEKRITLTMKERRDLFVRWGGNDEEFDKMVAGVRNAPHRFRNFTIGG